MLSNWAGVLLRQIQEGFAPVGETRPASYPVNTVAGHITSFFHGARVLLGVITDTCPIVMGYKVQCEKEQSPFSCTIGSVAAITAFGARSMTTLPVGTPVIVFKHPQMPYGTILGVSPLDQYEGQLQAADVITQASRQRVDEAHKRVLKMTDNGMLPDKLNGRALDAITAGEAGWMTETGLKITIDPFLVQLAADEATGLFVFYHDMLTRLAGHNLQIWSAVSERESFDDQGEGMDFQFYSPYPWEALGMINPGEDPHMERPGRIWQIDEPHYGIWEPQDDYLQPWHREQHFHGYLGQGGKKLVIGPPLASTRFNTYEGGGGTGFHFVGLFDQNVGLDGRMFVQSAKGFSFVKRLGICVPKRMRRPEQPELGDDETSYRAAGRQGAGPEHKITGDIEVVEDNKPSQRAAALFDLHAYLFNYSGLHPFFWHEKDWAKDLPEESDLRQTDGRSVVIPPFNKLAEEMYLDEPQPVPIKIDHRDAYTEQNFYQNEAGIDILEDGGVVIYDGYGAEIRMTAGSITFSAPGDIWCKAGRNVINWGGFDVILRAKNSIDLSATDRDIRIKAEKNLQILAGNDGNDGGILLESRASEPAFQFDGVCGEDVISSGIMLRAEKTGVTAWSKEVYVRTLEEGGTAGSIILDAGKGTGDVITSSKQCIHFVQDKIVQAFGEEENIRRVNSFSEIASTLSSAVAVDGGIVALGQIVCDGSFLSANGHIATTQAESIPFVGALTGDPLARARSEITRIRALLQQELPDLLSDAYQGLFPDGVYGPNRPGNEDVITAAQFSFRSVAQYKTEDFKIYEDRWQQMRRLGDNQTDPTWTENPVECTAEPLTYPYPGKEKFEEDTLLEQELELFLLDRGRSRDRGTSPELDDKYANPKYAKAKPKKLDGTYQIVMG